MRLVFVLVALLGLVASCVALDEADTPGGGSPAPATTTASPAPGTPENLPTPDPTPTPTPVASGRVTLNAVGDIMLARDLITLMDEHGSAYPYEAVRHLLEDADVTIGNMEGSFTDRGTAAAKFYAFRTPPRYAAGLKQAGFDVVSLGNNHAMDFGVVGLQDTMAALDAAGVLHSGAGMSAAEARRPVMIERNGLRLAFLSYNAAALEEASPAGPASPGVALGEAASVEADVGAARATADLVIVSIHAGVEYTDAPSALQRQLAQAAIDAGATLVLGHHAHVLQGWTETSGQADAAGEGVIVYGLGNFVFDLDFDDLATLGSRPFLSVILSFELTREGVEGFTAHPVFIDPAQNRPVPATGERLQEVQRRIQQLNAGLR